MQIELVRLPRAPRAYCGGYHKGSKRERGLGLTTKYLLHVGDHLLMLDQCGGRSSRLVAPNIADGSSNRRDCLADARIPGIFLGHSTSVPNLQRRRIHDC